MLIVGLTGSIGMGKSTAAARFRADGIDVCDADQIVHDLYAGAAAPLIEQAFGGTTTINEAGNLVVDRQKLGARLLANPKEFVALESIVHPLVREGERAFLHSAKQRGAALAVLEIPLLFETGGDEVVDVVVVVSSSAEIQYERVLQRPGMSAQKLDGLLARQMSDADKRAKADYIIDTSGPIEDGWAQIDDLLPRLKQLTGSAFEAHWAS